MIEDNLGDARLVREMLADARPGACVVNHVERLSDAVGRLDGNTVDVVLLDLSLPDAQGLETLVQVRAANPKAPIFVLSGHGDEDLAVRAVQSGAQDYLVKGQGTGDLLHRAIRYAIERKRLEERLAHLAQYDHLTGLANRALFQDRLENAIAQARRLSVKFALLLLDLDRFKDVNDTMGHPTGDMLLKQVAARLAEGVRETDTVARLGGDEFAIIATNLAETTDMAIVAQKILDALSVPYVLDGHKVFTNASIGITVYPSDADSPDTLLKYADIALYHAKDSGRGTCRFYDSAMNARAQVRKALENELRPALERGEFVLHYQPKVGTFDHGFVGAEALIRWNHPGRGVVYPAEFISVAESTGLILAIGEWVLEAACAQCVAWLECGLPPIPIAVNVSPIQFRRAEFVDTVTRVIESTGIDPVALELEITENMIMENVPEVMGLLHDLHRLGISLSIDDFGTGYSSLAYLKRFPVDKLKIDQSFIRDIAHDPDDAAITRAIITLGESLNLAVIAEGVESEDQLAFLRREGCGEIQGYVISKPLTADDFAAWFMGQTGRALPSES